MFRKIIIILSAIIVIGHLSLLNYKAYAEDASASAPIGTNTENNSVSTPDIEKLRAENEQLKAENERIKKELENYQKTSQNSSNTSTPPSNAINTDGTSNASLKAHVENTSPFAQSTTNAKVTPDLYAGLPSWTPRVLDMQLENVYQNMPNFHSPYQGQNSLSFTNNWGGKAGGQANSQIYGVYLGSQLTKSLQVYTDIDWFRGTGVSNGVGLGGFPNGDMVRAGSSNLPEDVYLARVYLRYSHPLTDQTETVERSMDQLPGLQAIKRWDVKIGKFSAADDFDQNRYANNSRAQFFNYDFMYNTSWDYAADTRGYSYGAVTSINQPKWRLASGVYMEPNTANGAVFDYNKPAVFKELGYNTELTLKPNKAGTVIRLLSYFNEGKMGDYNQAIALAQSTSTTPSLLNVEKFGGIKYGFGINFEQPLADDGETGLFARLGWNDGGHETWSYTEADRNASLGVQLDGIHWNRKDDKVGIAYGINSLSTAHKDYLALGGTGILLGDGTLNYGLEQAMEIYYRIQIGSHIQITPDFQLLLNPGYNRDRGPAEAFGIRVNLHL